MKEIKFKGIELQNKYLIAKEISEDYLRILDLISDDIRMMECFLQSSGFSDFDKTYTTEPEKKIINLSYEGKRLLCNSVVLLETPAKNRRESYQFLADFLESMSSLYVEQQGIC